MVRFCFPVGIGQVKRNSIKTHGTSCYVTGELIAMRYFLNRKMKKSKISSKSTHFFSYFDSNKTDDTSVLRRNQSNLSGLSVDVELPDEKMSQ